MSEGKVKVDWERIELDYRTGLLTLREIADANQISQPTIEYGAAMSDTLQCSSLIAWVTDQGMAQ